MQRIISIVNSLFCVTFLVVGADYHFPTTTNLDISFDINNTNSKPAQKIPVSFILANKESNTLNGFFYSDHVSDSVTIETDSILINGSTVAPSNYTYSAGASGEIYKNCKTHTWILQSPENYGGSNTIGSGSNSGKIEIHYSYLVKWSGVYHLEGYSWAGKLGTKVSNLSNTVFGYCDSMSIVIDNTSSNYLPGNTVNAGSYGYGIQRICHQNNKINFTMKTQNQVPITFRIYDVSGRILLSRNLSNSGALCNFKWNPKDQCGKTSGILFASMQTKNSCFVKKFTLLR